MIVGNLEIRLMADIARLQRDMNAGRQVVSNATAGMERAASAARTALAGIGLGLMSGMGLSQIMRMTDEYTKFTAQLKLGTNSQKEYAQAMEDVKRISTAAQNDIGATGVLYARIISSTRDLGVTQAQVAKVTETVNLALAATGAGANESASAMLQLSQAFGSGVLRGEEFNAVYEAAPELLRILAKSMGIPIGQLRKLAEEGKLTSYKLVAAFSDNQVINKLRENVAEIKTFSGAMTVFKNNLTEVIGEQLHASGVVATFTSAILAGAGAIRAMLDVLVMATKIGAAYVALFVIAPPVITATAAAMTRLGHAMAVYAMNVMIGQANTIKFNQTLFGTSVAAGLAAGAITRVGLALNGVFALYLGWQIGTYLNDQFVKVEIAAEVMTGELLKSWEVIKFAFKDAFDAITLTAREGIAFLSRGMAGWFGLVADGMRLIGKTDAADGVDKLAASVVAATEVQGTYTNRSAEARAEMEKNIKVIDLDTDRRSNAALVRRTLVEANERSDERAAAAAAAAVALTKEQIAEAKRQAAAYRDLTRSLQDRVDTTAREAAGLAPLTVAEKAHLDLTRQITDGKLKLSKAQESNARSLINEARANDVLTKSNTDWAALQQQLADNARDLAQDRYALITSAQQEAEQNERLVETFDMSEDAIIRMNAARLMEQETKRLGRKLTEEEIADLNRVIELKNRSADAVGKRAEMDAGKKAADQAVEDWKRASEDINRSLTDALLRGFESGKGFGKNLVDTIRNLFNTLILRPVISAIVNPVAGAVTGALGLAGTAQAATGGGAGIGSVASGLGTLGSLTSGVGLLGAGGLGLQAGFGALMSSGFAGIGAAVSGGIAAIGAGTGASIAAGIGTIAGALGPIALGIGAAVAVWKKFDTSGTKHTGGAATSSSAGTSAIKAQSLNMADIRTSVEAQKMVEGLTQGIVGILDSTALAFGKTAGYTAATAFADDTSKDGAWGSLMIQKLGQTVVNWQDTRGGTKWAPKTFADGEKGQEQYLAALTSSVRGALDSIGLPDWARTMLNGVASNASLENLAQVVEQINVTQAALGAMRSQLIGFSGMSDSAVSALMAAAGGIDKLFGNASAYYDAFYTEAEKNAVVTEQVAKSLAAVNLQMPATKEGYRALLEAQMKLGPAGAESVAVLFASAAAFAQVTAEAQIATDKNAEFEATLSKHRSALTDAYNAESDAISSTIDRMGSFAASLRGLRESALLGDLSPLSPQEKYAEAKAQYETVLAAARSGDESAQSNYSAAFNSFLTASRAVFASSGQYQADFAYAQASTAEAERWAGAQVDVGKAQLDALKLSVSGLITLDKSVLSVRDAILQMHQVMGTTAPPAPGAVAAPQINMPTPVMYSSYGADNTVALVTELKSVRQELASLRAEQAVQTGHLIQANAKAASDSADQISGATTTAVKAVANSEQRVPFE